MNDISLPDFHLRFVDNLESVSCSDGQQEMLLEPGEGEGGCFKMTTARGGRPFGFQFHPRSTTDWRCLTNDHRLFVKNLNRLPVLCWTFELLSFSSCGATDMWHWSVIAPHPFADILPLTKTPAWNGLQYGPSGFVRCIWPWIFFRCLKECHLVKDKGLKVYDHASWCSCFTRNDSESHWYRGLGMLTDIKPTPLFPKYWNLWKSMVQIPKVSDGPTAGIDDDLPRSELRALAAAQQAEVASNKDTTKVRL